MRRVEVGVTVSVLADAEATRRALEDAIEPFQVLSASASESESESESASASAVASESESESESAAESAAAAAAARPRLATWGGAC
eukprot:2377438-Rhodomonas_salina.3